MVNRISYSSTGGGGGGTVDATARATSAANAEKLSKTHPIAGATIAPGAEVFLEVEDGVWKNFVGGTAAIKVPATKTQAAMLAAGFKLLVETTAQPVGVARIWTAGRDYGVDETFSIRIPTTGGPFITIDGETLVAGDLYNGAYRTARKSGTTFNAAECLLIEAVVAPLDAQNSPIWQPGRDYVAGEIFGIDHAIALAVDANGDRVNIGRQVMTYAANRRSGAVLDLAEIALMEIVGAGISDNLFFASNQIGQSVAALFGTSVRGNNTTSQITVARWLSENRARVAKTSVGAAVSVADMITAVNAALTTQSLPNVNDFRWWREPIITGAAASTPLTSTEVIPAGVYEIAYSQAGALVGLGLRRQDTVAVPIVEATGATATDAGITGTVAFPAGAITDVLRRDNTWGAIPAVEIPDITVEAGPPLATDTTHLVWIDTTVARWGVYRRALATDAWPAASSGFVFESAVTGLYVGRAASNAALPATVDGNFSYQSAHDVGTGTVDAPQFPLGFYVRVAGAYAPLHVFPPAVTAPTTLTNANVIDPSSVVTGLVTGQRVAQAIGAYLDRVNLYFGSGDTIDFNSVAASGVSDEIITFAWMSATNLSNAPQAGAALGATGHGYYIGNSTAGQQFVYFLSDSKGTATEYWRERSAGNWLAWNTVSSDDWKISVANAQYVSGEHIVIADTHAIKVLSTDGLRAIRLVPRTSWDKVGAITCSEATWSFDGAFPTTGTQEVVLISIAADKKFIVSTTALSAANNFVACPLWAANEAVTQGLMRQRVTPDSTVLELLRTSPAARSTNAMWDVAEAGQWALVGQSNVNPFVGNTPLPFGYRIRENGVVWQLMSARQTGATWNAAERAFWQAEYDKPEIAYKINSETADVGLLNIYAAGSTILAAPAVVLGGTYSTAILSADGTRFNELTLYAERSGSWVRQGTTAETSTFSGLQRLGRYKPATPIDIADTVVETAINMSTAKWLVLTLRDNATSTFDGQTVNRAWQTIWLDLEYGRASSNIFFSEIYDNGYIQVRIRNTATGQLFLNDQVRGMQLVEVSVYDDAENGFVVPTGTQVLTARAITGSSTGNGYDGVPVPVQITIPVGSILSTVTASNGALVSNINPALGTCLITVNGQDTVLSHTTTTASTFNGLQRISSVATVLAVTTTTTDYDVGTVLQDGDLLEVAHTFNNSVSESQMFWIKVRAGSTQRSFTWPEAANYQTILTFPSTLNNKVGIRQSSTNAGPRIVGVKVWRDAANGFVIPTGTTARTACTVTAGGRTFTLFGGTSGRIMVPPGAGNIVDLVSASTGLTASIADNVTGAIEVSVTEGTTSGTVSITQATLSGLTYSVSDTATGQYWTDGKAIFRKTFAGTTPNNANDNSLFTLPTGASFLRMEGYVQQSTGSRRVNADQVHSGSNAHGPMFQYYGTDNSIHAFNATGDTRWQNMPYAISVYYTK